MSLEEFEAAVTHLGGLRPAARVVGVTAVTLRDYRRGVRPVAASVAEGLRRVLASDSSSRTTE